MCESAVRDLCCAVQAGRVGLVDVGLLYYFNKPSRYNASRSTPALKHAERLVGVRAVRCVVVCVDVRSRRHD